MLMKCDYCGKNITKSRKEKRWKHHFCNSVCYMNYVKEHPEKYAKNGYKCNKRPFNKLVEYAEIRKQLTSKDL